MQLYTYKLFTASAPLLFVWLFGFVFFFPVVIVKTESVYVVQTSLKLMEEYRCTLSCLACFLVLFRICTQK